MSFGAKILRRPLCAVPKEKAQSRYERDLTVGSIRTQNPLSERTCGFKSLLRYLFSRGFWSSGDWLLPRTKCQTHSEPITWVQGNGLARFTSDCRGLQLDFLYMESVKQSLGLRLRHRRLPLSCERTPPPWGPRSGWRRSEPGQPLCAIRRRARLTVLASALACRSSTR